MDRKKFIAVAISAALGLSGAPVYASESVTFSDGEVQEYGAEEEKQEFQTDSQDPETDAFQDKMESDADTDGFLDEATGVSSGEADANGFTYQYLKESDTYRLTKGTDTENVIIPYGVPHIHICAVPLKAAPIKAPAASARLRYRYAADGENVRTAAFRDTLCKAPAHRGFHARNEGASCSQVSTGHFRAPRRTPRRRESAGRRHLRSRRGRP